MEIGIEEWWAMGIENKIILKDNFKVTLNTFFYTGFL